MRLLIFQEILTKTFNLDKRNSEKCNILFDSGPQRTYITKSLKDKLNLLPMRHERISIKVFGTTNSKIQEIEIVKFKVKGINKSIFVEALVIPTICSTLANQGSNSVLLSKYPHLRNLRLAQNSMESSLNIDVLIGPDNYYNFIYGTIIRGKYNVPIALESTLGRFISGPYSINNEANVYNVESHFLFVPPSLFNTNTVEKESFESYSKIWDRELVGITMKELEVYQSFENELEIKEGRYSIKLPFKSTSEFVPDNYITSEKRLRSLKYKLDKNPKLKEQYANILCEYEKEGIIEKTIEICEPGNAHYLPHRPIVKENRETSKVRIVFDGSSKYKGEPSINELLESGPCLLPLFYDIFLRFRLEPIAIIAHNKQAFLQISVAK